MPTDLITANRSYQKPHAGNDLSHDIARLIAALDAVDIDMATALAAIVTLAPLDAPTFTGIPQAPTATPGDISSQLANTAFVGAALDALVDAAPGALDTLDELAASLGDDANFAATMTAALAARLRVDTAQSLTTAQKGQAIANMDGGFLSGHRNKIINGDFVVNQRGGTKTPGVGVYGYDRWKGHASGLEQVIEALPAGDYTLTWGGGGTGTFGGTTATSPFKATSAGGNVSVIVPATATRVSLVPGDATTEADPFSPRHIQQEEALCQRYYNYSSSVLHACNAYAATALITDRTNFQSAMRITPTMGLTGISGDYHFGTIGAVNSYYANTFGFAPNMLATGATAGWAGYIIFAWTADAEL